jgi:hypothetical protein
MPTPSDKETSALLFRLVNRRRTYRLCALLSSLVALLGLLLVLLDNARGWLILVLGLVLSAVAVLALLRETPEAVKARCHSVGAQSYERKYLVSVSDHSIALTDPHGSVASIPWPELASVCIVTTSLGPWVCDYWYVLSGIATECSVPLGATGQEQLVERLHALPGWDFEQELQALGSATENRFLCWQNASA